MTGRRWLGRVWPELVKGVLYSLGLALGSFILSRIPVVGDYLTTMGRSAETDLAMLADLRMPVALRPLTGTRGRSEPAVVAP